MKVYKGRGGLKVDKKLIYVNIINFAEVDKGGRVNAYP